MPVSRTPISRTGGSAISSGLQLADLQQKIKLQGKNLVKPEEVPGLLESLLNRHSTLRLLSMRTLAAEPAVQLPAVAEKTDEAAAKAAEMLRSSTAPRIWRHGVEIRLQGSYQELQAYVAELETLRQRLAWGPVQLQANYPKSELRLVLYTYSLDSAWLQL